MFPTSMRDIFSDQVTRESRLRKRRALKSKPPIPDLAILTEFYGSIPANFFQIPSI
jgi:hypothetical protein